MINLGLESLSVSRALSAEEKMLACINLLNLDQVLDDTEHQLDQLMYTCEHLSTIGKVVKRYGVTETLNYLYGENFDSMTSSESIVGTIRLAIQKILITLNYYITRFVDWLVSLFNNTKKIKEALNRVLRDVYNISMPLTLHRVLSGDTKIGRMVDEVLKDCDKHINAIVNDIGIDDESMFDSRFGSNLNYLWDRDDDRYESAVDRYTNVWSDYDGGKTHHMNREEENKEKFTFENYRELETVVKNHIHWLDSIPQAITRLKQAKEEIKKSINKADQKDTKLKRRRIRYVISLIKILKAQTNLICGSARRLVKQLDNAPKLK